MQEGTSQPLHNPHDRFFKEIFGRPEIALELFHARLPPGLTANIGWRTLALEPANFVDEWLAEYMSDLLFSVRLQGEALKLYLLFEHRSTPLPLMPLRLLSYMVRIWERWSKGAKAGDKPPCIIAMVLHQGSEQWRVSPRFHEWLGVPDSIRGELGRFEPDFEYVLIDLSRIPVEELLGRLVSELALSLMKAVREDRLEEWLERSESALADLLTNPDKAGLFRTMMRYAFAVEGSEGKGPSTVERFVAKIDNQKVKEGVMSIAEELLERGRREARQEAEQRAKSMAEELLERGRREARQEGEQRGRLVGRVQLCQQLLGLPVMTGEDLGAKGSADLERLLAELETRLRQRVK